MDIITRLNEFVNQRKLSSSQFADLLGIPRPSMSQILNGRNKKISNEFFEKLHQAFPDLDLMWLMFGETSNVSSNNKQETPSDITNSANTAPSLFDAQDNTYTTETTAANDGERVCEGVIEDLKTTAPYLREIHVPGNASNPSYTRPSFPSENTPNVLTDNTDLQTKAAAETTSIASTAIQASQRIESIIVYYKDKTFEVFKPE